jgi:glycosyltransferase involved in cell wall biosynthesis
MGLAGHDEDPWVPTASDHLERLPEMPVSQLTRLSVIIPCYNEEATLAACVERVLRLGAAPDLALEILIVDDCSGDRSPEIAQDLSRAHPEIRALRHERNQGKGAALRTGFREATGDYVAVQDADLEYDPLELRGLLGPLRNGQADVVYGSRFLGGAPHRVLYFWHYLGNSFLTLLSNMFTDLNLTDMETCYKVFRREIIQGIEIREDRFGFEPEITAKLAHRRVRIFEMGISYNGRTYEEGKKIGWRDGVRALYCIFRYNAHALPLPMQFLIYLLIGGLAATVNLLSFLTLSAMGFGLSSATLTSFAVAAAANYFLCIVLLFRHKARWNTGGEVIMYSVVVVLGGALDLVITRSLVALLAIPWLAKSLSSVVGLVFNFAGRRFLVFPERKNKDSASAPSGIVAEA